MQKYVIVDYQDFTPMTEAFQRLGYRVFHAAAELDDRELVDCELALFCMFKSIKQPLHSWGLTRRLNRAGVPVITWNRDGPSHKGDKAWRLWALRHFRYFNIYATHTLQDAQGFARQIVYLPNAAWDTEYHLGDGTARIEVREVIPDFGDAIIEIQEVGPFHARYETLRGMLSNIAQ